MKTWFYSGHYLAFPYKYKNINNFDFLWRKDYNKSEII